MGKIVTRQGNPWQEQISELVGGRCIMLLHKLTLGLGSFPQRILIPHCGYLK